MRSKNWTFICTAVSASFVASAAWAQCGEPNTNDCCAANQTPGCSDLACCESVCAADAFCCDTQWDQICANAAIANCDPSACGGGGGGGGGVCGDPAAGDCCIANGTPGCDDATCCDAVCAADAFCCDTEWDQICADLANQICEVCGAGGNDCDIGEATTFEAELCGEDLNGGCNGGGANEPIALGDIVQGSFWADGGIRDTDWYLISLTEDTEVSLTIRSNIPSFAAVVGLDCGGIIGNATTGECPGTTSVCLAPGDYYIVALPTLFAGFPCGGSTSNDYTLAVTGAPCEAPPSCSEICPDATVLNVGDNAFANLPTACTLAVGCGTGNSFNTNFYAFTPTESGPYSFSTCNAADFDTVLAVLSGCDGSVLACNDDGPDCAGFTSLIASVNLEAGVTYIVSIGGYGTGTIAGSGTLTIAAFEACEIGEGNVVEQEFCGDDFNGGCNGGATEPVALGDTVQGTFWSSPGTRDTDWYSISLAEDTEVTLAIRSDIPSFTAFVDVGCGGIIGGASTGSCPSTVTVCLAAGDYYIVALPSVFDNFPCGGSVPNDYTVSITGVPCDAGGGGGGGSNCDAPVAVTVGANAFANAASGLVFDMTGVCDPGTFGDDAIYNTNFYSFTPSASGDYSFSTCNTANFDTRLAVMTACGDALSVLACNDDGTGCAGFTSFIPSVTLQSGTTYFVAIGGFAAGTLVGNGTLTIAGGTPPPQPPANDECANATAAVLGANSFTNVLATGALTGGCVTVNKDVWYSFTATGNQTLTISICAADGGASTLDTAIKVFDACSGALVACNDDTCGLQSRVSFTPVCGTNYKIAIGSWSTTATGSGTFTISQTGSCTPPCPADLNGDGAVNGSDLTALLGAWGAANGSNADLNGDGQVNGSDLTALLGAWGNCPQ